MKTTLIAVTTNYTIRQKLNGVFFAQCNITKRFVKTEVALAELQAEIPTKKVKITKNTSKNIIIDNFILIMCLLICTLSVGVISYSWITYDMQMAIASTIMFTCTFLFPYLLAKDISNSKYTRHKIH